MLSTSVDKGTVTDIKTDKTICNNKITLKRAS